MKTFAEMRKEWEEAKAKMKEQAAEAKEEKGEQPEAQYEIDFTIDKPGQRKTVNGYDCELAVMTIAVRQKGKKLEDGGGHGDDHRHVDGAEDPRHAGTGRLHISAT